jgi:hypothetical protein
LKLITNESALYLKNKFVGDLDFSKKIMPLKTIEYFSICSRANQEQRDAILINIQNILSVMEVIFTVKNPSVNDNSKEVLFFQPLKICKAFRLHFRGSFNINQSVFLRLMISCPKKIPLSNYNKMIYTLRNIQKNPILDESEVNNWSYDTCSDFLKKHLKDSSETGSYNILAFE